MGRGVITKLSTMLEEEDLEEETGEEEEALEAEGEVEDDQEAEGNDYSDDSSDVDV